MSIYVSLLTAGTNSHEETSENANAVATDFVSEGVIGAITNTSGVAPATGAFAVNAQSTPDMTVAVSSGVAYVSATPSSQNSQTLRVRNSASSNVTISSNTSGSTKYDWVYIKLDAAKAASPAVDADDVATLVTSRSSSSTSDNGTPPTYGYPIAVVTVANSASSITNANITDKRALSTSVQDGTIDTDAIASAAVTNAKLSTSTGEIGAAWQTWTPTITGFSAAPSGGIYKWTQVGKTAKIRIVMPNAGTSNATTFTITLPFTTATNTGAEWGNMCRVANSGTTQSVPGWMYVGSNSSTLTILRTPAGDGWTASGLKSVVSGELTVEVA